MLCLDAVRGDAAQQQQFQKQSVGREITKGNYVGPASYHQGNPYSGGQKGAAEVMLRMSVRISINSMNSSL